jgi:hypothetical protein
MNLALRSIEQSTRRPQVARSAQYREALEQAGQLTFWACFDAPADHGTAASNDDEGEDDPLCLTPIVHRVIPAADAPPLAIRGPSSIFDMGAPLSIKIARSKDEPAVTRVIRSAGVTKCQRIQIQDTPEWQQKEAARRARQVLPKPPKQVFKMRGSIDRPEAVEA